MTNINRLISDRIDSPTSVGWWYDEVVKYSAEYYNDDGVYTRDEWTDASDIGKMFDGKVLSWDEYLRYEDRYANVAKEIMEKSGCKMMTFLTFNSDSFILKCVQWGLENMNEEIKETSERMVDLLFPDLKNCSRISIEKALCVLRLSLRNIMPDAFIINLKHDVQIDVGWDYYMHVHCPLAEHIKEAIVYRHGLFLNPRGDYSKRNEVSY